MSRWLNYNQGSLACFTLRNNVSLPRYLTSAPPPGGLFLTASLPTLLLIYSATATDLSYTSTCRRNPDSCQYPLPTHPRFHNSPPLPAVPIRFILANPISLSTRGKSSGRNCRACAFRLSFYTGKPSELARRIRYIGKSMKTSDFVRKCSTNH